MKKVYPVLFLIIAITIKALAVNTDTALKTEVNQWIKNGNSIRFFENKGQMADMQHKPVNSLLFKAKSGGTDVYITKSGLSYVFTNIHRYEKQVAPLTLSFGPDNDDSIVEKYCRADMDLVDADIRKENIVKEDESEDRTDYYLGGICPYGIKDVHSYGKVTIKNIYPGIDWVICTGTKGLKYDFVVHPGANPSLIRLNYKWTAKPELQSDGSLKISVPMGTITEGKPLSYTGDPRNKIQTDYILENNEIRFNIAKYDTNATLTIDPTLVWATYYGLNAVNESVDVTGLSDDGTSVWVTGVGVETSFPGVNPGGGAYFQGSTTISVPSNAIVILQFTTAGVLKWATYYGGSTSDVSSSIYSDGTNVWVTGSTVSTNFPTLNPGGGAYFNNTLPLGFYGSAFIIQFSTTGVLKWATYYGGTNGFGDLGTSIQSDGTNVWVTGLASSNNFPTLNPGGGAYFQGSLTAMSGEDNAFILQFNTSGVRQWATYYGGSVNDGAYSIYSDGSNVWLTGQTASADFPTLNPGGGAYFQGTNVGPNAFILQFNTSGVRKWATYYGANGSNGAGYSIQSDGTSVWVTGSASGATFPTLNPGGGAYFQASPAGAGNAFILQFNTSGVCKWATCYGGNLTDEGFSIQSDGNNVWVCGETTSSTFPTYSPGNGTCGSYYGDSLGSTKHHAVHSDVFILQFSPSGVRKWATFYGEDAENDGSHIASDGTNLFVAGDASANPSTHYPTLNPGGGAYYQYYDTIQGGEPALIGKFCIACGSYPTITLNTPPAICEGDTTTLIVSGGTNGETSYAWSNGETTSSITVQTLTATMYKVSAANGTCASTDSATVEVKDCDSIYIPNVFTPNGNLKNRTFTVTAEGLQTYNIEIFNRWGKKLFESSALADSWDGRSSSGTMQSDGVYYYLITGSFYNGHSLKKAGFLQLIQ